MSGTAKNLQAFLDAPPSAALVEVAEVKGSTPREKGAWMLVSPERIFGTIGGGQLEFMAIARAREMLAQRDGEGLLLDIPLGPEIGQCCGGRVNVAIRPADEAVRSMLLEQTEAEDAKLPHVYVFGGGHVGHALASAFALLPVRVVVVETRADALDGMPESIETRLTPVPEEMVRDAPSGSAFVVLTHDHALDFLIVTEALKREDAAYVGMIGSKTKKATFRSWYLKTAGGSEADFARLVSPIGGDQVKDKRPAVIAALAAAEIMTALAG
jgi:xanthine dehydrogenase accessory factor